MYVHIGKEKVISFNNIITILNLEEILENKKFNDIIKELDIENNIIDISDGNLKSLIIVKDKEKLKGYISNISSNTLGKRINKNRLNKN